jgi:hypothetical protein
MNTDCIRALKPSVDQSEALRAFSAPGLSALYWRSRGPLRRIADVYVPFRVYRVSYEARGSTYTRVFALDAVEGSLDLFAFAHVPRTEELVSVTTRNYLEPMLEASRGSALLYEKVLRVIFQQGFFKLREPKLQLSPESDPVHIPYWLAFYGRRVVRCRVLDAVRRQMEGAKARAFFEQWLAA